MNTKRRIYLDNAATSWPKPEAVYQAVDRYQREIGAAAGRGAYEHAQQAQRVVAHARTACARILGIADPQQIAFTANGTAALNLAIHGLLRPGDHVVTTVCEHNSVLRPLQTQAELHKVQTTYVGCDSEGYVDPDDIHRAMQPHTRLVAINHASNVTGAVQPIAEITRLAHERQAIVLLDAAQTAGCLPIDVEQLGVDLLATGGHKSLLGPLGTGLLYASPSVAQQLRPLMQGGTGVDSQDASPAQAMPEMLEVGNLNVPALAGLAAGAEYLLETSIEALHKKLGQHTQHLLEGLSSIKGLRLRGPRTDPNRVSVVSFEVDGYDPQEFASCLDAAVGVESRAGLHCAPRMHAALGSDQSGGLIRLSPGWSTTNDDLDQALTAIAELSASAIE